MPAKNICTFRVVMHMQHAQQPHAGGLAGTLPLGPRNAGGLEIPTEAEASK